MSEIVKINIAKIKVGKHEQRAEPNQEDINLLANSIAGVGLLSPLLVSSDGDDYNLVAGHRRLAAVKKLGWLEVECIIRQTDEKVDPSVTFAENFHRQNLTPLELAAAITDEYKKGTLTIEEMARVFQRSENWVSSMIAMMGWPKDVLEALHNEVLSVAAAANIARVDETAYREFLLKQAAENGATARTTASWLQAYRSSMPPQEAITQPEAPAGQTVTPMVPQAPCLACGMVQRTDRLSHVPICQPCIQAIRNA